MAFTIATRGAGRSAHVFLERQLTFMLLVQREQFSAGIGNLVGINDAVVIDVQRPDDCGDGPMMARSATEASPALSGPAVLIGSAPGRRTVLSVVLRPGDQCGDTERHDGEEGFYFCMCSHNLPFICCLQLIHQNQTTNPFNH